MKYRIGHRLPKFTEAENKKLKKSSDFVGMNYYTSSFEDHIDKGDPKSPSWETDALVKWEGKYLNIESWETSPKI